MLGARSGPRKEEDPVGPRHRVAGDPVGYKHGMMVKRYPEPHGQVTAYNRSPVH